MAGIRADLVTESRAPVEVRLEVDVAAPPARVWEVLTRFEAWPAWHRGVQFAVLRGELSRGSRLLWRADGMRIRSELQEVESSRVLGMSTRTLGGRGYHRWTLIPRDDGGTLVRSEEVWDGLGVRLLRRTLRRTLDVSRRAWLAALRERVESEAQSEPDGAVPKKEGRS